MEVNILQLWKAYSPMDSRDSDRVMEVSSEHLVKAFLPMVRTLSPTTKEVIFLLPEKALSAMATTGFPR